MVRAIDVHIHVPRPAGALSTREQAMDAYFGSSSRPRNAEELAAKYRELDIFGVILSINSESVDGEPYIGNDSIAAIVRQYPEQFIGFGSVDPWAGKAAVLETERCAREFGLHGMKFHPSTQEFYPNDPRAI